MFTHHVNTGEIVNTDDSRLQLEQRLRDLLAEIPWLSRQAILVTDLPPAYRADFAAEIETPGGPVILVGEVKSTVRPSDVENVTAALRDEVADPQFRTRLRRDTGILSASKNAPIHLIFAAPWISPRTAEQLTETGLGWFDLAGNAEISFPGIHIQRSGIPNPFPHRSHKVSWSSDQSQRVLRLLLHPVNAGRAWRQRNIQAECFPAVSIGLVNKIVRRLLAEAYARETENGTVLVRPEKLLRDWSQTYKLKYEDRQEHYTALHGDSLMEELRGIFQSLSFNPPHPGMHVVLASYSAAKWQAPYARVATTFLYASPRALPIIHQRLHLQTVPEGANVILMITRSSDPYRDMIESAPGIYTTSLVQTYLDLAASGERGREAAEHLLTHKLLPEWKR